MFWTGFIAGIAFLWTIAIVAGFVLGWLLNRSDKRSGASDFIYPDGLELLDEEEDAQAILVPYSHVSSIGRSVKGQG